MGDDNSKLVLLCVIFATLFISAVALILGIVAVAGNRGNISILTGNSAEGDSDDKIWVFQIGHYAGNTQYLDDASGTIRGYNVDVVNAVCRIANKNCRLAWDLYERCWDSQTGQRARGGEGLMGRWYDACVGWAHTLDRARSFLFSESFEKTLKPSYWVKAGSSAFSYPQFTNRKVGILDGWSTDEHCIGRYDGVVGLDPMDDEQILHYPDEDAVIAALLRGDIDVAFLPRFSYLDDHTDIDLAHAPAEDLCVYGGPALMMPKDQFQLVDWFDAGFMSLKASNEYQDICDDISQAHGDQPGSEPSSICVD